MKPTLVIAKYQEDISWADNYTKAVIQKGVDMPNIGREISSFFWFILTNYDKLEGDYIFLQGHPFDHCANVLDILDQPYYGVVHKCKGDGSPEHNGLNVSGIAVELNLPVLDEYTFYAGAQHRASTEQIKKRPYEWYAKAFSLSLQGQNPWAFERLIPCIYE